MSPEQALGKRVDKRTDIWAFGCILYEMLTGRRAFTGETVPDTIAAIFEHDPDWSLLPETTPPAIQRLLQRCLEKDTKRRLRDIGDGHFELGDPTDAPRPPAQRGRLRPSVLWIALGLVGVTLIVDLGLRSAPRGAINEVIRFGVPAGDVRSPSAWHCHLMAECSYTAGETITHLSSIDDLSMNSSRYRFEGPKALDIPSSPRMVGRLVSSAALE